MVAYHDSTPGRTAGGLRVAGHDDDLQRRFAELQRLIDHAAEQQAVVTHGAAVVAEFAKQAQARLDLVGQAADEMKLDELAELLRRQSPARQRQLLDYLEDQHNG